MKGRILTMVLVLVVVAVVAIAYLAFVGLTQPSPNVGAQSDPTGQQRDPIGYAVINIHCVVSNPLLIGWQGALKSVSIATYPWVNGTSGAINQMVNQKYDPLGLLSSNCKGYVKLRFTGPGNYLPLAWTSPDLSVKVNNDGSTASMNFGPYTAKFWDPGQYSLSVTFYLADGRSMGSTVQTFTIAGS